MQPGFPRKAGRQAQGADGFVRCAVIAAFAAFFVFGLFFRGVAAAHASGIVLFETSGPLTDSPYWGDGSPTRIQTFAEKYIPLENQTVCAVSHRISKGGANSGDAVHVTVRSGDEAPGNVFMAETVVSADIIPTNTNTYTTFPLSPCLNFTAGTAYWFQWTHEISDFSHEYQSAYHASGYPYASYWDYRIPGIFNPYGWIMTPNRQWSLRLEGPDILVPAVTNLAQFKSDGVSPISEGVATMEDTTIFSGTLSSSSTNPLQFQVEYTISTSTPFTGNPNGTSTFVVSGSPATIIAAHLRDGNYRWRARAVDTITNAVSNWQEFGATGNTDFVVHQVPLYTQGLSSYPSSAETDSWDGVSYANGKGNTGLDGCGATIAKCGCAITSAVMVMRYHGITTMSDGRSIDPLSINDWLNMNNGYVGNGNVDWVKVAEYSKDAVGITRLSYQGRADVGDNASHTFAELQTTANSYLAGGKPVIVWEKALGHFLVLSDKLASTYVVRDPDRYNTRTLDDNTNSKALHIRDYNNFFDGVRLYTKLGAIVDGISLNLASPAELFVTDPQGHRLGKDPVTGISYNEIPNGAYGMDGISNAEVENPTPPHIVKNIWIPSTLSGNYSVKVIGTGSGSYTLDSLVYATGTPYSQTIVGSTTPNAVTSYTLQTNPQSPGGIALIASSTLPSVADTYLRQNASNLNYGKEQAIRLRANGDNRALVAFNNSQLRSAIASGTVVSAILELSVSQNGKNWGKNGGTVDIHRMTHSWTELGATWNCPNDTNTANSSADCAADPWTMTKSKNPSANPWAPRQTASLLVTNTTAGTVRFDVTNDVKAFLAGTANYGWLLKKTDENGSSLIEFASRETTIPPRLVIQYKP